MIGTDAQMTDNYQDGEKSEESTFPTESGKSESDELNLDGRNSTGSPSSILFSPDNSKKQPFQDPSETLPALEMHLAQLLIQSEKRVANDENKDCKYQTKL